MLVSIPQYPEADIGVTENCYDVVKLVKYDWSMLKPAQSRISSARTCCAVHRGKVRMNPLALFNFYLLSTPVVPDILRVIPRFNIIGDSPERLNCSSMRGDH